LASLAIKTLAKPMSKQVKHYFTKSTLTNNLLITIGQTTNNITTRMQIWSAGYKVQNIKKLDKEAAVKQGAELVGEFFIFSVAGALVVWEYDKSKKKEKKKDNNVQQNIIDVRNDLNNRLDGLEKKLGDLEESILLMNNSLNSKNSEVQVQQQSTSDFDMNIQNKRRRGWFW
jgi:hypothetical protein